MKNVLIILGSSRSQGNTTKAIQAAFDGHNPNIVDLLQYTVTPYDYENKNKDDDFVKIAEKIAAADAIVFATPVYWYSMSAQLKTLFDRFTDLITIRKDLGRALNGKECYLIASGTDAALPEGFEIPFSKTCSYLDMNYRGCFYYAVEKGVEMNQQTRANAKRFGQQVFQCHA